MLYEVITEIKMENDGNRTDGICRRECLQCRRFCFCVCFFVTSLHYRDEAARSAFGFRPPRPFRLQNVNEYGITFSRPGMQAAFVDIGLERAAFIHVDEVVEQGAVPENRGNTSIAQVLRSYNFV